MIEIKEIDSQLDAKKKDIQNLKCQIEKVSEEEELIELMDRDLDIKAEIDYLRCEGINTEKVDFVLDELGDLLSKKTNHHSAVD